jgi:hypothetical protein
MFRTRRQELIWLLLIGGCIALFVAHRERTGHRDVATYDRGGLNALFRENARPAATPDDDIVTGSIVKPATARYYVPLGSYDAIDDATRRYLGLVHKAPALEQRHKLRIETVALDGSRFHRVRMGNFDSVRQAKAACAQAGVPAPQCPVVASR